jgi:hypothetical protein
MTSSGRLIACSFCSRRTGTCARSATSPRLITSKVLVSKICGDQIVRASASTDVNLRSRRAYHIAVAIERVQETGLVGASIWLNSPQCALFYKECRFQRAVVPPEPHGSPGLVIRAAMIWKLNHGLPPIGLSADEPRASRLSLDLCRGLVRWPRDAHIEAICGWPIALTRFGVAKLRAAVRAMLKQYDGAEIQMATRCRITSLPGNPRKQIAILLAIRQIVAISEISSRAPGCYR